MSAEPLAEEIPVLNPADTEQCIREVSARIARGVRGLQSFTVAWGLLGRPSRRCRSSAESRRRRKG